VLAPHRTPPPRSTIVVQCPGETQEVKELLERVVRELANLKDVNHGSSLTPKPSNSP
jgi:hypothetical protein